MSHRLPFSGFREQMWVPHRHDIIQPWYMTNLGGNAFSLADITGAPTLGIRGNTMVRHGPKSPRQGRRPVVSWPWPTTQFAHESYFSAAPVTATHGSGMGLRGRAYRPPALLLVRSMPCVSTF